MLWEVIQWQQKFISGFGDLDVHGVLEYPKTQNLKIVRNYTWQDHNTTAAWKPKFHHLIQVLCFDSAQNFYFWEGSAWLGFFLAQWCGFLWAKLCKWSSMWPLSHCVLYIKLSLHSACCRLQSPIFMCYVFHSIYTLQVTVSRLISITYIQDIIYLIVLCSHLSVCSFTEVYVPFIYFIYSSTHM